jgi:poly(A)-specific ribonuclease
VAITTDHFAPYLNLFKRLQVILGSTGLVMDIDYVHFWPQLLPILKAISEASFVTFDLEMSGISTRERDRSSARSSDKPSLQQQYEETKEGAETYQVLQIGITCVEEDRERGIFSAKYFLYRWQFV